MEKRIAWIDIAKGICLLSVVLGHVGLSEMGFVYAYHLTTFFILAGYTLKKTPITQSFLKKKFQRLMTPYFITCFAVVVMEVVNAVFIQRSFSIKSITKLIYTDVLRTFFASGTFGNLGNIELGRCIGAVWFLPAMFFALIFVQILLNYLKRRHMMLFCAIITAVIGCVSAQVIWLPFSIQAAMLAVPFILLGVWLREYQIIEKLKWYHYLGFGVIFLIGCLTKYAQVFYMVTCTMKDWLFTPLVAVCASLFVIGISKAIRRMPVLEFIGKNSMIFLCVHLLEMNTFYPYYNYLRGHFNVLNNKYIHFIIEVAVISAISCLIIFFKSRKNKASVSLAYSRDFSIDMLRSLLIILMIIGHVSIDWGFSKLIYSFHMMAFVMISGYFYKSDISFGSKFKKTLKILCPYCAFAVLYILFRHQGWMTEVKDIIMGISFTDKIFTDFSSVGPVYFILLLFFVRLIYICIDQINNEWIKNAVVFLIFFTGIFWGQKGLWLPWSLDCAMVSLLFYHLAHYMRKYCVLQKIKDYPFFYFLFSCVWALMVYSGSMELAVRRYGNVGLMILGVLSAFIIMYLLCCYLVEHLPRFVCLFISLIGQSTAYILIIHTLFGGKISAFVSNVLRLNSQNIFYLGALVLIQVLMGVGVLVIIQALKRLLRWGNNRLLA